jgi:Ni,Fe-hydrogenase maturation factor
MSLSLFNDFIIDSMKEIGKKKKLTDDDGISNSERISVNEHDLNILQIIQQKKEEKEALKKMLSRLNELQHLNKTNKKKSKH